MQKRILGNDLIRTGLVWNRNTICLLTCDPEREQDSAHATLILVTDERHESTWVKFSAHTLCKIRSPATGLVIVSDDGFFAFNSTEFILGNIFEDLRSQSDKEYYGSIRSVNSVAGVAIAVGLRGTVARYEDSGIWSDMAEGLSESIDLHAIDGFDLKNLYAVGSEGQIWIYDGVAWEQATSPTNVTLTSVKCAPDGRVYVAGHNGILIVGDRNGWTVIDQQETTDDLWGIEWFRDSIYVSSFSWVYRLSSMNFAKTDFGLRDPFSCYQLDADDNQLISIGERDVIRFDGRRWDRLI